MRKILAVLVAALMLVGGAPTVAHAGGSSSGWPTTAPLPAGTIVSRTGSKAVVLSPRTVAVTLSSLDAAYRAKGWTVGSASGIPRWYKRSGAAVDVYFAALDGGQSSWTLVLR